MRETLRQSCRNTAYVRRNGRFGGNDDVEEVGCVAIRNSFKPLTKIENLKTIHSHHMHA